MNADGTIREDAVEPAIDDDTILNIYKTMIQLTQMDLIFYEAQRQGRISFYLYVFIFHMIHLFIY